MRFLEKKTTIVILVIIILKILGVLSVINIQTDNQNDLLKCVSNIYNKVHEKTAFLFSDPKIDFFNNDALRNNTSLTIFTKNNLINKKQLQKYHMFILIINSCKQFETLLETLSKTTMWNSRAKFIVGYFGNEDIGSIFNISWNFNVFNINVVAEINTETNVYTFFPYHNKTCGEYINYELLFSCNNQLDAEVFPQKVPLDLNGCEIKAMAYVIPPYVINLNNSPEDPGKTGLEVTIIHNVAKRMNIKLNYLKNPHRHWGYRFKDGSFTMMYKALKDRDTDIIFGFTYGNSSYSDDFDASFCHLGDASIWFFSTAPEMAQWKNLTNIFEKDLWFAIFGMLFINGIFWWIIGRKREISDEFNDIVICIMSSLYILLQGSVKGPDTWKVRIIFILWILTCLLIFTAHQCQLISILTSTLYEHQMTTLEELVESGIEFGFYPTIEDAYKDINPTNIQILKRYQPCPLTAECLNRTAFQRNYAVVKNRRQVLYLMPRFYTFPNGRPMLYDTGIASFTTKERYYTYKGFPLLERFNFLLMLLSSNGLINKWDADTRFFVYKVESDSGLEPLTVGHLQGAFFIYIFGMSFAITTLLCECIKRKICRVKQTYNNKKEKFKK